MPNIFQNQKGVISPLILVAVVGVLITIIIANTWGFKEGLFAQLFPKPTSRAATTSSSSVPSDLEPPTISITSPSKGIFLLKNTNFTVTANATDNVRVTRVEFYINDSLECSDFSARYSCDIKLTNKPETSNTITAKAFDASGNSSSHSINVSSI